MKPLKIGKLEISDKSPAIIIAEIADSHNGSMDTAKKLVDAAKVAGCDVAKFQLHLPDTEMVPGSINMWDGPLYDILKRNLFTREMHADIKEYCEIIGIEYLCTPFCPASVDILDELNVKFFKTGSGELTNLPMQRKLAKISTKYDKPVIVSTGMSKWEEIEEVVKVYVEEGAKENLIITHCTSEYPPNDYTHINLKVIEKIRNKFDVWVGLSSHTLDNYPSFAAIALGAKVIEKHFTLSRDQEGPDHFIAQEPHMMKELVDGIRKIEDALGSERKVSSEEQMVRDWAHHSVVTAREVKAGEELTLDNLIPKRPGSGIPAKYLDSLHSTELLGKKFKTDLPEDTILQWKHIR